MRWTANRKAAVIEDVRDGVIDARLILAAWGISAEEYREWERAYDLHGKGALKATRLQAFRGATRRKRVT
jgi:hypothetical protein